MVEITTDNTFNIFKSKKFGYLGGSDFAVSDDGLTWSIIQHYTDLSLTNPSTALINGYYYIADDTGIRKTKDFNTFFDVNTKISDDKHSDLNNFEWFQDLNGSWFIKYNASTDTGAFTYYADFDETTDSFVNAFNQFVLPTGGASGLQYVRGKYYIWQSGDKLFRADNFTDKFVQVKTDIVGNVNHNQFSSVVSDNYLYVYFAVDGKTYVRSSKVTNLIHWSEPVEVDNVELGSYFYNTSAISVYPDHDKVTNFDKVLKVTANGFKQTVPISCMVLSSLQVQWEQNSTYQISFTAFDDGSVSYTMLSEEAQVEFNGQTYVIKQAIEDASGGVDTKTITASHIYNEINRVRQRNTKTGTLTYSVQDVLSFYLDDKVANPFGFTYAVYGSFDKQQIENLGNSSGSDMLSKITEQWPQAIIYPDNKNIRVYSPESFAKDYGGRIDYLHNSSDVKMTVDSTTITNQVKVFGKQIENTDDNATDNAPVKYYFDPFIVDDKASIKQYGLHPMDDISDERFTDKNAMQTFAKGQLSPNPAVSIEVTGVKNEMPLAGEQRHLIAKPLNLETDLTVIGYTWYPFDSSQITQLSFANLPASILKTQANVNNRIRTVQLMAQQAINSAKTGTRNYISPNDPMQNDSNDVHTGDIWTLPLVQETQSPMSRSVNVQDESTSETNQTIYTDPDSLTKIDVQLSIWNGSRWLEISNQRTTNKLNDKIDNVANDVAEAQKGIDKAEQDAQNAVDSANEAIEQAGFANDTATTAKEVAENTAKDATQAKEDSATALTNSQTALTNANNALSQAQQAITDAVNGQTDISELQTTVDGISDNLASVSDDLDTARTNLDSLTGDLSSTKTNLSNVSKDLDDTKTTLTDVSNQAKANGTDIVNINQSVGEIQTDVADTKGNVAELTTEADELSSDMTDAQSNISSLQQTATSLSSSIKDNTDNISSLQQTATELSSSITSAQGDIGNIQQNATSLQSSIENNAGDISDLQQTASSLSTAITNAQGDISTLQQTATALSSSIKDNTDNISSIKQTATQLSSDMKDAQGNISSLQQSTTDLSSTIGTIQKDLSDTQKTVSSQGTQITQNAKDITSKANKSDLDATNKRMTTAETSIKQNAKDITSKASQLDVNTLTGRVSTAESNITQNANNIKSKVSSSDVQDILDNGKYATQTWTGSQIDQKANEISSTVTEVSNKVDNLSYDNRNLLSNLDNNWEQGLYTTQMNNNIRIHSVNKIKIDSNSKYTFSWEESDYKIGVIWWDSSGNINSSGTGWIGTPTTYLFPKDTDSIALNVRRDDNSEINPYDRPTIKIEKGTKATDWTPAPEDLATVTALSKVDQKADSISTTVTNNKTDADSKFTNVNQTISGIQSTVKNKADSSTVTQLDKLVQSKVDSSTYNSKVTQLANDINLRVQSKDLLSQINVQAGSTLMQSKKLYLDSSSVVFSGKAFIPSAAITSLSADKLDVSKATIGNGDNTIDMTGSNISINGLDTSLELNSDSIFLGQDPLEEQYKWGLGLSKYGLNAGIAVQQAGTEQWRYETQGYIGGYARAFNNMSNPDGTGNSGLVVGITTEADWKDTEEYQWESNGGDYFSIGKYVHDNIGNKTFEPAWTYSATGNDEPHKGIIIDDNQYIEGGHSVVFENVKTAYNPIKIGGTTGTNGIYFDQYGNIHGDKNSYAWTVDNAKGDTKLKVMTNGNAEIYFGNMSVNGSSSFTSGTNVLYFKKQNGDPAYVHAGSFTNDSSINIKKNIRNADNSELAKAIYNLQLTKWNYKYDNSRTLDHIGAVIGDGYRVDPMFLSEENDGVDLTNIIFSLVGTVQQQAQQMSELMADVVSLKIKVGSKDGQ